MGAFEFRGYNHLALVCSDMARTVEFYSGVLGMRLTKTIDLPMNMGQHFFFDCGNGDSLAFFWFPDAPKAAPGLASAAHLPDQGKSIATAHGSMNHVAFNVPAEKFDEYCAALEAKGVKTSRVLNHDDSEWQVSAEPHAGTFVRSVYFFDPDGILLEFAAWTRPLDPKTDATADPVDAQGRKRRVMVPAE